ncbi:amidohydrolase family protein [Caproiciproducens sp.]
MFDVIIKNAQIIDGTGKPGYRGDVGIRGGKIVRLGKVEGEAGLEVDAAGLTLSPGFIDSHEHSDRVVLDDPLLACKLEQGITTELAGQCGGGPAPSDPDRHKKNARRYADFGSFIRDLEKVYLGINLALFVPHGSVRAAVMGYENRHPTNKELEEMKAHIRNGLGDGALGMSSGLCRDLVPKLL